MYLNTSFFLAIIEKLLKKQLFLAEFRKIFKLEIKNP